MDIDTIEMTERRGKFLLKKTSPAMANALRRTMLSDIPKMAIDKVEFHLGPIDTDGKEYESVTPLFDEIIAHRLGMVPVPTRDEFTFQDKCSCGGEGCPSCSLMYSLNRNGPCTVLSGDMIPLGDSTLKVKDENIPIVDLTDGQAVLIYATAIMGTAKKHVKWQAAFGVGYRYVTLVPADAVKGKKHFCQEHMLGEKGGKLIIADRRTCSHCETCGPLMESLAAKAEPDDTNFLFTFETDGSLTAKDLLVKAAEILKDEAKELAAQIEAL